MFLHLLLPLHSSGEGRHGPVNAIQVHQLWQVLGQVDGQGPGGVQGSGLKVSLEDMMGNYATELVGRWLEFPPFKYYHRHLG